ncbi:PREDICTED: limbin isoform X3 [Chinchilla lanigera]|nr:PREDICTED: limbin isoform X3 [Chinchilla lanigera]XP_005408884.1 PREDICTED: limbin isoform X3 [Chinchilla lanigera]XP_013362296.1 PREDICTED: limbin isoform X3 [Chinchilla lanigera]XP_013362297.1 PREDICTED: limbin isoform X3 [Chinchilla lanigera]
MIWPRAESSHLETAAEAPCGMKSREKIKFPVVTSAASPGPRAHSFFAFIPPWPKKSFFKRESPITQHLYGDIVREVQGTSENGVIFQKCALVSGQSESQTVRVHLVVNNTQVPLSANLSDLLLLDDISGLTVRDSTGNKTPDGLQAFRKKFLPVGDSYLVSYTASLDPGAVGTEESLNLPAQLTFQSSSPNRTQLQALLTITVAEKITVLPHHGLHAAGFVIGFLVSLVLSWVALFFLARYRCLPGSLLAGHQTLHPENKLEPSPFASADGINEDLSLNDQMIDILTSEDPRSMLPALEELEIATLNRADADLEACRTQISRDIISLLLRNLTSGGHLSPQVERRIASVLKKQFLLLENEVQEEYDRKMLALTAECDLETRKKTENQYQKEMVAMEEAEELLKRVNERSAAECSSLLRTLHGLEQEHLWKSLALHQEEDFAQAHRQLAVFQRNELHSIFFAQIKNAIFKGELKPEAAKVLLQDYSKLQENLEELMDFLQATKRYHLSKRFGHREYLVQNLQSTETRVQGLLSTAATQLTQLIQKHERAGYLDEDQMEMLLERVQMEVFSVKQKLDNDLKQEKKKLRQKLITKRRRELLQKHREQRKEQLSTAEAFRAAEDAGQYLRQWRSMVTEHSAALEELQETLDQAALDDVRALTLLLSEKATEELRRLQSSAMTQELLKRSVPWLFLQQILEEQARELAARTEQLEAEERERGQEGVQGVRQRLRDDALEAATEEQAELRRWEHLVFMKLCGATFSLSEEELLAIRQEVHSCFAQMDRSLALPKVRARVLLHRFQTAWREAELLKLDQALAAPELQSKARKPRSKSKSKVDLMKKCIEDKVRLFEEQPPADLADKVRGELLRERVQRLEAQEARFAESLVALQFQKAARATETLSAYTALLSIQDLLLEALSESEALTKLACSRILESHSPEIQELERKLEEHLSKQEVAQQQRFLTSWQDWGASGPGVLNEPGEADSEGHISSILQQALSKGQQMLEHHQQSLREEQQSSAVLEDLLENMETDTFSTLCSQELRLAAYLTKMTTVPGATLRRLLSVVMPTAPQPLLLTLLDSVSEKHPEHTVENPGSGEQPDPGRRRKHQSWWQALESRLRADLRSRGLEKMLWAWRRKESILKKTCLPIRDRLIFSGKGSWPHLSLEPVGELAPVPIVGTETIDVLNTGEKLFIFRNPKEPEISLHVPPRKKKNFLNARKASRVLGLD